ncbi:hypothetical protein [Streptomyces sp. NBC_01443]|uniref:hypothetical protein n=1 Tax=Streptomyces sp. NBC_01443 TaxID=2903868 RepID=UPI00224C9C26|nr:hypothetical protein [Streptomyces sp. NBC_01443]MCX4625546.1 hypothetical protein [Streptomyces sp. NBC_01443]
MALTKTRRIVPALMIATAVATGGVSLSTTAFAAPSAAPSNITTDDDPGPLKLLTYSKLAKISKAGGVLTKAPPGGGARGGDTEPPKGGGTGAATGGDTGTSGDLRDDFDYGVWVGLDPRSGPIVN